MEKDTFPSHSVIKIWPFNIIYYADKTTSSAGASLIGFAGQA